MLKSEYRVIGIMSGTSLDGIDICLANFKIDNKWTYKIMKAETLPYHEGWKQNLNSAIVLNEKSLTQFDNNYTSFLNHIIHDFIKRYEIDELDAICSHGHTVFHQPEEGLTYQIGNKPQIAENLKCPVVCDFRVADVKLGGQGAPLVPIGDELLFYDYDICLNLGGFANLSKKNNEKRIAYDICPVNIVLNHYTRQIGLEYDSAGNMAKSGKLNKRLLETLNDLEFYKKSHPKSLGLEWVHTHIFPLIDNYKMNVEDILRTFNEHIAIQLTNEINQTYQANVLLTGGGTYNTFLIECIKSYSNNTLTIPSKELIDFKEALIFGFLGILKMRNEINCLCSVTGAFRDHSSGVIYT